MVDQHDSNAPATEATVAKPAPPPGDAPASPGVAHAPVMPPRSAPAEDEHSFIVRSWSQVLAGVLILGAPLSWLLRIRETPSLRMRVALPLAFLALVGWGWSRATEGEYYLARLSRLSALDAQRENIEKVTRCPVRLGTREKKLWTSKELLLEINELTLARPIYEARKSEIATLGQFDVEPASAPGEVTLKAQFNTFFGERIPAHAAQTTEAEAQVRALETALPGVRLEERSLAPEAARRWLVVEHAIVSRDVAATGTARAALDAIVGRGAWTASERPDGAMTLGGAERKEERLISSVILPSPREMLDSIPSLLNQRWTTWSDARAWWGGTEVVKPRGRGPMPLDRHELNEVPFALLDRALHATVGPDWSDWLLLHAVLWSTVRIIMGFAWAAIFAIPLGVLMGSFGKVGAFFEPVRLMGSYLPLPAFVALTIAWWGTSEAQKVGFLAIASFVVLLPQVIMAIEAVPGTHLLASRTLGATRLQQMRYVLYAGARAEIFRALRLTFAVGWTWVTLAESVDPKAGLGYVMFLGERRAEHRPHIYVVIVVIVALAFLVNSAWLRVERWLYPYREAEA